MAKIEAMNVFSLRFLYDVGAILEISRVSRSREKNKMAASMCGPGKH